eukprot:5440411-Pyramimonas_sp.AAC.1
MSGGVCSHVCARAVDSALVAARSWEMGSARAHLSACFGTNHAPASTEYSLTQPITSSCPQCIPSGTPARATAMTARVCCEKRPGLVVPGRGFDVM